MTSKKSAQQDWMRIPSGLALGVCWVIWIYLGVPYHRVILSVIALLITWECITLAAPSFSLNVWVRAVLALGVGLIGGYTVLLLHETSKDGVVLGGYALSVGSAVLSALTIAMGFWLRAVQAMTHRFKDARDKMRLAFGMIIYASFALSSCAISLDVLPSSAQRVAFVMPLWLTVVATDVGGYIGGRCLGGPKIAPWISPGKTWAGAGSGLLLAVLCSWAAPSAWGALPWIQIVLISLCAQMGDALESIFKRYYNVKDSSALIPGHGGVFDRLDGFIGVHSAVGWSLILGR